MMDHSVTGREKIKQNSFLQSTEIVMLMVPFWLLLFYFKDGISKWIAEQVLSLSAGTTISNILIFFLTTLMKVLLLLVLIIFIMGVIRTWLPVEKIRNKLNKLSPLSANGLAGLLGVISPFCSCSAIPVFISFLETGIPLGITFSFLIASPLVNEIIIVMLFSLFGWKIAGIYLIAGLTIAVISGYIIDRLKLEKHLPLWLLTFRNQRRSDIQPAGLDDRFSISLASVREVLSRTWIYIVAGILIGALIHGYVPDTFLYGLTDKNKWVSLPLIVLTGIPLYSCSAGVAPVAFALVAKGMPPGSALAFIMAVAGLSLPEFIMLRKVLSVKLILIFVSVVFAGILIVGSFFNFIL